MDEIPIEARPAGPDELRFLLVDLLPGIDRHERTGADIRVWSLAAKSGHWTCAQLAAGVMELIPTFTGYCVKPADLQAVIDAQTARIRTLWYCPDPPRELADDPAREAQWRRWAGTDYRERALYALAAGDPIDDVPLLRDPEPDVPELAARRERMEQITKELGARKAVPAPELAAPPTVPAARDPQRMAEARAELDARRPGDVLAEQEAAPTSADQPA